MATWTDVRRIALALPGAEEVISYERPAWTVNKKFFVWDRPLRKSDLSALGDAAPDGPILGVYTGDLELKDVLLASDPSVFFTTPHFDGYAAVLVQLRKISAKKLKEIVVEAWLARAPKRVAEKYLAGASSGRKKR
ncbi:MAG: MmcQ/YjbR family DNA-binding protein [Candidatus Eremiobacteraeota bacterium]|nr:MmcQ/YjbR family DNA-binding protein [Candidatus Eremiobacteraeota bacterium]